MLLNKVKQNSGKRFSPINVNLIHLAGGDLNDEINKIQRGLFYVHLYSALERTTNELVERVLIIVNSFNIKYDHYIPAFNTISLSAQMMSYKAAAKDKAWLKSHSIFETMCSDEAPNINNTFFAASLQNVWFDTIQSLLLCFGLATLEDSDKSKKTALDEIVNNRNAVAHGRIPADIVGERHRPDTLRDRTEITQQIVELLIIKFEEYLSNLQFIKQEYHAEYLPKLAELTKTDN
jgi:hypothetical protein